MRPLTASTAPRTDHAGSANILSTWSLSQAFRRDHGLGMLQRRGPAWLSNVIKAGAVLSLTGRFAPQGEQARRGLALWAEGVNRRGGLTVRERGGPAALQLLICDDQSRTGVATARAERLTVDERVDLLFGPYSSVLTLAVAAVAERHGKVLWNHGGSSDAVSQRGLRFVVNLPSPASRYFR